MSLYANKRINYSIITEKIWKQWNVCEKIAIILYHENNYSKNKTTAKFNIKIK